MVEEHEGADEEEEDEAADCEGFGSGGEGAGV